MTEQMRWFWCLFFVILVMLAFTGLSATSAHAADKWTGVDETVIEKIAKEHGREARSPLINTDQGDLLLFVFLVAGVAGGFAAGYYWRGLMEGRKQPGGR
jgi:ABC-type cobalt transport system substrate-binding protein